MTDGTPPARTTTDSGIPAPSDEYSLTVGPAGQPDFAVGKGVPARGEIYNNEKLAAAVEMPHTVPIIFSTEGLTCGYDGGSRVAPDAYNDEFRFTGTLTRVTLDLSGDLIQDSANDLKIAMARQ